MQQQSSCPGMTEYICTHPESEQKLLVNSSSPLTSSALTLLYEAGPLIIWASQTLLSPTQP